MRFPIEMKTAFPLRSGVRCKGVCGVTAAARAPMLESLDLRITPGFSLLEQVTSESPLT